MKFLLLLITISISLNSYSSFNSVPVGTITNPTPTQKQSVSITSLTAKQVESFIGRKLTLKEKVQWFLAKKMVRMTEPEDKILAKKARSNAFVGFGFSLAGIFLLPLFAIPAIILSNKALAYEKEKPGTLGSAKSYAKAGRIIGWIGIAMLVIAIFLIALILAMWGGFN